MKETINYRLICDTKSAGWMSHQWTNFLHPFLFISWGKYIFPLSLSRSDYIILMMYDSAALMGTVNEYFLSYGSWSNIRPERPRRLNDKGRWLTISHMATNSLYSFERNFYFPLVNWAEIFNIKSGKTDRTF